MEIKLETLHAMNQPQRTIHFLHIGKTGGTSIKTALNNDKFKFKLLLHDHSTTLSDIPQGEGVFFFLREPIDRFISSFYSRQRQGQPRFYKPWSTHEMAAFNTFSTANQLAEAITSLNDKERAIAKEAMNKIRHVKTSFFDWLVSENYFEERKHDILFIGLQCELNSDFNKLKEILDLPEYINLPEDPINTHRSPVGIDRYLSGLAKANLAQWYKRDILFFDNIIRAR